MMNRFFALLFLLLTTLYVNAQTTFHFADSIRIKYQIPEIAFAVVSADSVFELQVLGVQRANTDYKAKYNDRFHIGSNTKAITAFIAALLVENKQITWDTRFFDLFPELKRKSRKDYYNMTLENLLTFRAKLPAYTYTFEQPTRKQITGNNASQRLQLARYFILQKPMKENPDGLTPSNADYILAGLMLEKASGKSYKDLIVDFGKTQGIYFDFDYPNLSDTLQPWGHDIQSNPLPPFDNYKLNWLLSAGNINVSLPDYIKFIQLQLKGLKGQTKVLSPETFDKLLYGLPVFSFGWFNQLDRSTNRVVAYNEGNAGAFLTQVEIIKDAGKGYILFANSVTNTTKEGLAVLMDELKTKYR